VVSKSNAKIAISFRFVKNAQSGAVAKRAADELANATARFLVEDVVFAVASYRFDEMKRILTDTLQREIGQEMDHMISLVSSMMSPPDGATSPQGNITPAAGTSAYPGSITAQRAGVNWSSRSYNYMMHKARKGKPQDWWVYSGQLQAKLGTRGFYTSNFGPIRVTVSRFAGKQGRDSKGRFQQGKSLPTRFPRIENIQSLGLKGRPSVYYTVATVAVDVFGYITADMLPSIASDNPADIAPNNRSGRRIVDLVKNKAIRNRLGAAKKGEYRQLLDPFLSYYLTRAVPGRVNKVLERTIQRTAGSSSSTASTLSRG